MMKSILEFNKNKKGLSAMIAYVLLISMAIALSGMIYSWLKFYVDAPEVEQCPEGVSLVIADYDCDSTIQEISVTLKNRGRWTVNGFNLRAHDRAGAIQGLYQLADPQFKFPTENVNISPGDSVSRTYEFPCKDESCIRIVTDITIIELQPIMEFENAMNKTFCKPIVTQTVECQESICGYGYTDYNGVCLPGLISLWSFDSDASDSVGSNDGSLVDNASVTGGALVLDGSGDYVDVSSNNIDFGTDDVSVSFWMKRDSNWTGVTDILGNYITTGATTDGVWFYASNVSSDSRLMFRAGGVGDEFVQITNTDDFHDGEWHHIVGTLDRGGNMSLYVDGGVPQVIDFSGHFGNGLGVFQYIGDGSSGVAYGYHNGSIDEVMVFDEVLSTSDVAALYALGRS